LSRFTADLERSLKTVQGSMDDKVKAFFKRDLSELNQSLEGFKRRPSSETIRGVTSALNNIGNEVYDPEARLADREMGGYDDGKDPRSDLVRKIDDLTTLAGKGHTFFYRLLRKYDMGEISARTFRNFLPQCVEWSKP